MATPTSFKAMTSGLGRIASPLFVGQVLGDLAAPAAIGLAGYLRSPQGVLLKDRLRQGDIPGAFTAVTGIGRSNAPRLTNFNPPGFNPSQPVSTSDLLSTVASLSSKKPAEEAISTLASTSPPAERAYLEEKNRATQLAAQDQLAKKYQVADLTKAYNVAKTPEEKEKLGLQIWATTNPQLAQKLKPGQLGYTEATSAFMSSSPLGSYVKSVGDMQFADKVGFPGEPVAGAFNLETPISGITLPENLKQVGVAETFGAIKPGIAEAIQMGYSNPLQLFKPDLTQTQQALLRQAFEKGLK